MNRGAEALVKLCDEHVAAHRIAPHLLQHALSLSLSLCVCVRVLPFNSVVFLCVCEMFPDKFHLAQVTLLQARNVFCGYLLLC